MSFCIFFEEQAQDIALLMALFEFNVMLSCNRFCLFIGMDFIEIHTCIFLNSIQHGDAFKGLAQIQNILAVGNLCCAQNLLRYKTVQVLCQIHHAVIIGKCLIQLHQSKFRIMSGVNTFITEYTADFVNALQTAYDQSL